MEAQSQPHQTRRMYDAIEFNKCIADHKLFLSEREHRDVGTPATVDSLLELRRSTQVQTPLPMDYFQKHVHAFQEYMHALQNLPTRDMLIETYLFENTLEAAVYCYYHAFHEVHVSRVMGELLRYNWRLIAEGKFTGGTSLKEQYKEIIMEYVREHKLNEQLGNRMNEYIEDFETPLKVL